MKREMACQESASRDRSAMIPSDKAVFAWRQRPAWARLRGVADRGEGGIRRFILRSAMIVGEMVSGMPIIGTARSGTPSPGMERSGEI